MVTPNGVPVFSVVSGEVAHDIIFSSVTEVVATVADAYVAHANGKTINPDSYFLRFPKNDSSRIIALPAYIDDGDNSALGIKWISSFPANITNGVPRASAALIQTQPTPVILSRVSKLA
jgi:ornithine cyclodeaminase/alanine dehydrogenase-like protein (mu-crystallin family)